MTKDVSPEFVWNRLFMIFLFEELVVPLSQLQDHFGGNL